MIKIMTRVATLFLTVWMSGDALGERGNASPAAVRSHIATQLVLSGGKKLERVDGLALLTDMIKYSPTELWCDEKEDAYTEGYERVSVLWEPRTVARPKTWRAEPPPAPQEISMEIAQKTFLAAVNSWYWAGRSEPFPNLTQDGLWSLSGSYGVDTSSGEGYGPFSNTRFRIDVKLQDLSIQLMGTWRTVSHSGTSQSVSSEDTNRVCRPAPTSR